MLVLHAFWSLTDGPGLWAEDSDLPVFSTSTATKKARPHPFAAKREILEQLFSGPVAQGILRLPSVKRAPVDSGELIRLEPRRAVSYEPALHSWSVPVRWISVAQLVALAAPEAEPGEDELLRSLLFPEYQDEAPQLDVKISDSVRYLRELAIFAQELVLRARVLPQISWISAAPGVNIPEARWAPVLRGPDSSAAAQLLASMPPSFRAEPGSEHAGDLFTSALGYLTDATVRSQLPNDLAVLGKSSVAPDAAQAWVQALAAPTALVAAESQAVQTLQRQLADWEDYTTADRSKAHLVLRLAEMSEASEPATQNNPVDLEAGFRLDFMLRSAEDHSLLVGAEQVWADDSGLSRWLGRPREVLLSALGKAARIYPAIRAGLRAARPLGIRLDANQTVEFLSAVAPELSAAGFEVLLPNWLQRQASMKLKLAGSSESSGGNDAVTQARFGLDQLCDFEWKLAIGEMELTADELQSLAKAKSSLVRLRGQWIALDAEQLRGGLDFLTGQRGQRGTAGDLLQLAAGHGQGLPLELESVVADGWLGSLLNGSAASQIRQVDPPRRFQANLRGYQRRGLSWLNFLADLGLGACLADDMGLGKTVQLLAFESVRREMHGENSPTLLVCPMSLIGNWEAEAKKFAPYLSLHVHHGSTRHTHDWEQVLASHDLIITTYSTLARDTELFAAHTWNRIVFDEAQAVKNRTSLVRKALKSLPARHRVALTGTPVENRLGELYSLMDILNPGLLGSPQEFRTRYSIPIERHQQAPAAERLRRITEPYLLRRVKTDPTVINDLPEKIEIDQYYTLSQEQATLYQSVLTEMMDKIAAAEGIERRGLVLAAMAKLKQVCNHPAQLLHDGSAVAGRSGKVARLEELLEQIIAEGDKVLCFTQYTEFAQMLLPHLATRFDADIFYLHGGTSRAKRTQMVQQFQESSRPAIFLLSLKAGGTGLNLTAANHVMHLDRWWNPAVENQATDRAFRIGQKRTVQVRKFICRGTLEERIDEMIRDKQALADLVVGDGEGWLTELSTDSLRDLFALSTEAIDA
ncbi:DEAD/DEAH box helicase [Glutamicibacter sp. NPDC087344]|uniref:DEAD/DEAH box helicase n=1 Tax=Glutamicibacter sp. NPDC087344 TaxID=3363994 RepID=UPI00382CD98F